MKKYDPEKWSKLKDIIIPDAWKEAKIVLEKAEQDVKCGRCPIDATKPRKQLEEIHSVLRRPPEKRFCEFLQCAGPRDRSREESAPGVCDLQARELSGPYLSQEHDSLVP